MWIIMSLTRIDSLSLLFLPVPKLYWSSVLSPPPDSRFWMSFCGALESHILILSNCYVCQGVWGNFRRNCLRKQDVRKEEKIEVREKKRSVQTDGQRKTNFTRLVTRSKVQTHQLRQDNQLGTSLELCWFGLKGLEGTKGGECSNTS